jgi:hypothetical protein
MNGYAIAIATSYFIGQIIGHVFTFTVTYLKKPLGAGMLYFAGKNHEFLTSTGSNLFDYFKGMI